MKEITNKFDKIVTKPAVFIDYNVGKTGVDLNDQMSSYGNEIRKSYKWYRKLMFELVVNTCVVNAWLFFKHTNQAQLSITEFRIKLVNEYLGNYKSITKVRSNHRLKRNLGRSHVFDVKRVTYFY